MANQCQELVGNGAVAYTCRLEVSHAGPHVAPENGPSQVARAAWQRTQDAAQQPAVVEPASEAALPQIAPETDPGAPALPMWRTHDQRLDIAMVEMRKGFDELPKPVASWVRGAQAQLALIELWEAAKEGPVTLSRDDLTGLIPDYLQV